MPDHVGLPEGWALQTLVEVTSNVTDGTHMPPPREASGVPLLSAKDIANGVLTPSDSRFVSQEFFASELKRTQLEEGDVLVTIVGSIGRSAVVPASPRFAFQRSVAIVKPSTVTARFLSLYLRSPAAFVFYRERGRGTAQQGIYLRDLKQLPVPVPPREVQDDIVQRIDELFEISSRIRTRLETASMRLEGSSDAILAKAFRGGLSVNGGMG
jgi:type I restriction enzyme S subunit